MLHSKRSGTLTRDFRKWVYDYALAKRQEELLAGREPRRYHPSVKNYVSALNLLLDYEYDMGRNLSIRDVDEAFLADLISYSFRRRENTLEHRYLTRGGVGNKTVNKRIDALFFFLESTYPKKQVISRPKHLETLKNRVVRLSVDELHQIENIVPSDLVMEQTRDYFLFLCYTGLRFGDFAKLDRTYFDEENCELVLNTNKTKRQCRIHLNPKAFAIARKYDFRFSPGYNQDLNKNIKRMLRENHLFETTETVESMKGVRIVRNCPKRELISCHTGRRTYISILAENGLTAYEIMSATGHTQTDTVMRYIDIFGKKRRERFTALDRLFE